MELGNPIGVEYGSWNKILRPIWWRVVVVVVVVVVLWQ